jgi:hypothetical protein
MHDKTGRQRRPTRQLSAMTGSRWSIETGWVVKKCSPKVIGGVSALASWIRDISMALHRLDFYIDEAMRKKPRRWSVPTYEKSSRRPG